MAMRACGGGGMARREIRVCSMYRRGEKVRTVSVYGERLSAVWGAATGEVKLI